MKKKKTRQQDLNDQQQNGFCRDFLRNVCYRDNCKYQHVLPTIAFCHDFQNTQQCLRKQCKYVHGSYIDEQFFLANGKLPDHLKPVCHNFLKNQCFRDKCKFLHPENKQVEPKNISENSEESGAPNIKKGAGQTLNTTLSSGYCKYALKARKSQLSAADKVQSTAPEQYEGLHRNEDQLEMNAQQFLSEENNILRMKINELECRIEELEYNNTFLMKDNYVLRNQHQQTPAPAGVATLTVPAAVTITNTTPLQPTQHLVNGFSTLTTAVPVSIATMTAAAPVSIATMTAGAPVSIATMTTGAPVSIATMTAGAPVSIATMTAGAPVSIATMTAAAPVSIATMTGATPVSIATVSMAPVQIPPVVSVSQSLEHQTTSLIYPILTQVCSKR